MNQSNILKYILSILLGYWYKKRLISVISKLKFPVKCSILEERTQAIYISYNLT